MSNFKEDLKLLAELDAEIKSAEAAANPPEYARDLISAIIPGAGKLMPIQRKQAQERLDRLRRVKDRLAQLIEKEYAE
jgi:hypothetical protein